MHTLSILNRWWILQCIQGCSGWAVPEHHESSKWFKWHTLRFFCLHMTFDSQVQLPTDVHAIYPKWRKDPSCDFKDTFDRLFQGAMAALNGSDGIPWGCLALIWHLIISWQLPTQAQVVYPSKMTDPSNVFKDAVDGCSRVPWQLWMVEMTCLDVVSL